ncbi:MAG: hypothetical protein IJ091_01945 [Oscillospiraceae bacterium]|nr:hypothetical protein [Oscillospiraceae bacterium]
MAQFDFSVDTKEDLINAINRFGIIPYFRNSIPGFSIEEHVSPRAWFSSEEGVWEWKGPVIREANCAYGKFFEHKAAFISMDWYPDFANFRRDGYDFDARYDDGLVSFREKELYDLLVAHEPILSKGLKVRGDYRKEGKKGFETLISRLQATGYVVISDFVYLQDKAGRTYGWGVSEYSTPEKLFGDIFTDRVYARTPEESYERLVAHLMSMLPEAEEEKVRKFIIKG